MADPSDFFGEFVRLNPFPPGHQFHHLWVRVASLYAEQHARVAAGIQDRLIHASSDEDYFNLRIDGSAALFDFYGELLAAASTYETLTDMLAALDQMVPFYTDLATRRTVTLDANRLRRELALRLGQRKQHWTAECHKQARLAASAVEGRVTSSADSAAAAKDHAAPVGPASSPPRAPRQAEDRGANRRKTIEPLLEGRGWSRARWASAAGVDTSVVYDYLKGVSAPRPETRRALAGALDMLPTQLPQ